MENTKLE